MNGNKAKTLLSKHGVDLERLNVHSHHGCNLRCSGCNHHSEYLHVAESINIEQTIKDLIYLLDRVSVRTVTVLGGEPLLNAQGTYDLCDSLLNVNQQTNLITNGMFLDKHSEMIISLLKRGLKLKISLHIPPKEKSGKVNYKKVLDFISVAPKQNITITEEWKRKSAWFHILKHDGDKVYPFESLKEKAFDKCVSNCPQLYKGRIYKCAHSAYFKEILEIKNQQEDSFWSHYIQYNGYDIYDDLELKHFLKNVYEPESICSSCPSDPEYIINNQDPSITKHRIPIKEVS